MPSGFQQDSNQLQPALFRVVIDMSNSNIFTTGENTYNGKVNPYTWDNFAGDNRPTTVVNAESLARGNIRWQRIVEEVSKYSDAQILDIEVSFEGGEITNGDTTPDSLAFTVKYDRFGIDNDEGNTHSPLLAMERQYLRSINNDSTSSPYDGEGISNTYEAVQEAVMRALIEDVTRSVRVFRPDEGSDPFVGEGYQDKITARDVTANEDSANYEDLRNAITVNGPLDGTTVITGL